MRRTKAQLKLAAVLMDAPEDRHWGYPMQKTAGIRSGVLYPILARWEDAGFLTSDWAETDPDQPGKPRRRYYTVTPAGRGALGQLLETQ